MQYELKFNSDTTLKFKEQDITHTNLLTIDAGTQSLKNRISVDKISGSYKLFPIS